MPHKLYSKYYVNKYEHDNLLKYNITIEDFIIMMCTDTYCIMLTRVTADTPACTLTAPSRVPVRVKLSGDDLLIARVGVVPLSA